MTSVVLAKALYNNDSEADDELSFKKGDVITVLETDFEGMTGWWLCSLGDKQGVAPGNRLQLISFGGDAGADDRGEIYDSPSAAHKKTYGDVDYDVPKTYAASEHQDYAIPKSPYGDFLPPESQRHGFVLPSPRGFQTCDLRNSNSSDGMVTNEVYGAQSRWSSERSSDEFRFSGEVSHESGPEEMYDVPSRNSMESDDGGLGGRGNMSLHVPVIPPKTGIAKNGYRGNVSTLQDVQEIYDSPASVTDVTRGSAWNSEDGNDVYDQLSSVNNDSRKVNVLMKSFSSDDQHYDTLPSEIYDVPPAGPEDIYDVPPGESSQPLYKSVDFPADGNNNPQADYGRKLSAVPPVAADDTIYDTPPDKAFPGEVYDNFEISELKSEERTQGAVEKNGGNKESRLKPDGGKQGTLKKEKSDNDDYVDYAEIYGQEEPAHAQEGGKRKSEHSSVLDRIHMDKVRELRISRTVAMENLDKLQQAVDVAVTKLMSFVTEDWRRSEVYALNMNGIREISGKVKVALRLLTEFGLGSLVNSQKLPKGEEISKKIKEALEPLLVTYYSMKNAIQVLDETNWRSAYHVTEDDELNSIVDMARGIPCGAYNLGAVIANVSCLLFTKPADQGYSGSVPVISEMKSPSQHPSSTSSAVTVQKESIKGLDARKVTSEPVGMKPKQVFPPNTAKSPAPKVSPKPKKDQAGKKEGGNSTPGHRRSLSGDVSELTNNLLNQIEDVNKQPLRRKGSRKLSPKTVRRLCSIGLKNEDNRISEKIFEDVATVPPKPLRHSSSSPISGENTSMRNSATFETRRLSGTVSDPGPVKSQPTTDLDCDSQKENTYSNGTKSFNVLLEGMDSEFVILKEGIKSFVESVRERQKPKVFVAHSKFIVLSAHKLVYVGDGASRNLADNAAKKRLSTVTNSLSEVINDFVENIKVAARQYPEQAALNDMIKYTAKVTERALELYKVLREHAES